MTKNAWIEAINRECRDNPGFAHAWATIQTRADKYAALYDVPTSGEFKDAVKARTKTVRANRRARDKHQAYLDAGCVRVRGALGGVYYE